MKIRNCSAASIAEGTMSSVLCVLLRTPRKKIGVLHLDRGLMDKPFTKDDMQLADALAPRMSRPGIEGARSCASNVTCFTRR